MTEKPKTNRVGDYEQVELRAILPRKQKTFSLPSGTVVENLRTLGTEMLIQAIEIRNKAVHPLLSDPVAPADSDGEFRTLGVENMKMMQDASKHVFAAARLLRWGGDVKDTFYGECAYDQLYRPRSLAGHCEFIGRKMYLQSVQDRTAQDKLRKAAKHLDSAFSSLAFLIPEI